MDIESRVAAAGGGAAAPTGTAGRRSAVLRKGARTTSCRLVFRVTVLNGHGRAETLQIASRSIICSKLNQSGLYCVLSGGRGGELGCLTGRGGVEGTGSVWGRRWSCSLVLSTGVSKPDVREP